ncbi:MAG: THUMP domain-containing protein [Limnobacter sp.]|nr:THUMP domain-containing protein [Limnobacter sp.]
MSSLVDSTKQTIFNCFASCPKGLEAYLAEELNDLGASEIKATSGGCEFKAGWPLACRITYWSRLAGRIGLRLVKAPCRSEEELYQLTRKIDWPNWFSLNQTFRVDLTNLGATYKNPRFAQLRIKDGVCDAFSTRTGQRPDVDTGNPDVRVFAATTPYEAFIYIDLAGENLFKRGWRLEKGHAPLKENLAAGIWKIVQKSPNAQEVSQFLDPFCGSGTLVIESLSALCDRAPGLDRPFSFENLKPFDPALGQALQKQANERFNAGLDQALENRHFHWRASDITQALVEMTRNNLIEAGFEELLEADLIKLSQNDVLNAKPWHEQGLIVTNPPYGERVRAKGADVEEDEAYERLFKAFGDQLKQDFSGWTAFLFSGDLEIKKTLGLAPKRKAPLFNGAIECRLFEIPLTKGSYRPRSEHENPVN